MRRKLDRGVVALLGVALILVLVWGCGGSGSSKGSPTTAEDVKVAIVAPVTGNFAFLGTFVANGVQSYVDEVNAKGGPGGHKLVVTVYDTAQTNDTAIAAFQKAIGDKPAVVVGFPLSTQMFAVADMITREKIPVMVAGTNTKLVTLGDGWVFNAISDNDVNASAATAYLVQELGKKRLAVIHSNDEYGTDGLRVMRETAQKLGAQVVSAEAHSLGDKDMSAQLTKIKGSTAEALLVWSTQTEMAIMVKQTKQLGLNMPVMTAIMIPATVNLLTPEDADGLYTIAAAMPWTNSDPVVQAWVKRYQEKYKIVPDAYATSGYDGMWMLSEAIAKVGANREGIRTYLQGVKDFKGMWGPHSNNGKGSLTHQAAIAQLQKDKTYKFLKDAKAQ